MPVRNKKRRRETLFLSATIFLKIVEVKITPGRGRSKVFASFFLIAAKCACQLTVA